MEVAVLWLVDRLTVLVLGHMLLVLEHMLLVLVMECKVLVRTVLKMVVVVVYDKRLVRECNEVGDYLTEMVLL